MSKLVNIPAPTEEDKTCGWDNNLVFLIQVYEKLIDEEVKHLNMDDIDNILFAVIKVCKDNE